MIKADLIKELEQYPDDMELSINRLKHILNGEIIIKKCGLESCGKSFITHISGTMQIYCGVRCRQKAFLLEKD